MLGKLKRLARNLSPRGFTMAATPPICNFGEKAHDFELPATDGRTYRLADLQGPQGHRDRVHVQPLPLREGGDRPADPRRQRPRRRSASTRSRSPATTRSAYPADSFDNMKRWAEEKGFPFKYLYDESQAVARAYDAVCTPTSSATTPTWSCSTAAGSTSRRRRRCPRRGASCTRR